MNSKRHRSVLILMAAAMLCALISTAAWSAVEAGSKAPDFKLQSIESKTLSLSQIRKNPAKKGASRVVVVDFWSTTCPPCVQGLPNYQKLQQKYAKKGLAVVGIALDRGGIEDVKPFVKERKLTYTMLVDPKHVAADLYGIRYTPTTFVIDKKGVVRYIHIGASSDIEKAIENEVKLLLK